MRALLLEPRVDDIFHMVGWAAGAYLAWRALVAALRVRWARHAYPAVTPDPSPAEWQDRCRGALIGGAIGDAVNLPAESVPRWLARLRYPSGPRLRRGWLRMLRRPGDVSDDTQLTIAVARSIDPDGTYVAGRFREELAVWSYFRVGAGRATVRSALAARRRRASVAEASEGNGGVIRVAPLAIAYARNHRAGLVPAVEDNARATHASDVAARAAVFFALLVRRALTEPRQHLANVTAMAHAVADAARESEFELGFDPFAPSRDTAALACDLRACGTGGHVRACVPAMARVLLHHRLDFAGAMRTVFRAGGDTDSIGALVGTVIGAQIGAGGLPREWALRVQHGDYLRWLADRLASPAASPRPVDGRIALVHADVASRDTDVVVNAWNRNAIPRWLLIPQGVSRALRRAGGRAAIAAVSRRAPVPLGGATETGPGRLGCRWVVHVAGIDLLWRASERSVRDAVNHALDLSRWLGARTVALPVIGAGSGGMEPSRARDLVMQVAADRAHHFDRIEVVVLDNGCG